MILVRGLVKVRVQLSSFSGVYSERNMATGFLMNRGESGFFIR